MRSLRFQIRGEESDVEPTKSNEKFFKKLVGEVSGLSALELGSLHFESVERSPYCIVTRVRRGMGKDHGRNRTLKDLRKAKRQKPTPGRQGTLLQVSNCLTTNTKSTS